MTLSEMRTARLARAKRYIQRYRAGETMTAIAASEGITHERVGQIMVHGGYVRRPFNRISTSRQHAIVIHALQNGATNRQAAAEAGVTINVVAGLRDRRGFSKRKGAEA